MQKNHYPLPSLSLALLALVAILFAGCETPTTAAGSTPAGTLAESFTKAATGTSNIDLFVGHLRETWNISISDPEQHQILNGESVALSSNNVQARTSDKAQQRDALTLVWKDTWRAGLSIEGGAPLDLREHMAQGVLSLDLNVIELAKGGLDFKISCGPDCERKIPFTEPAFGLVGKGWQPLRFSLDCFAQEGDDFSAVSVPFALEAGGAGEISVANIQLLKSGEANASCPDYKTVAVSPAMLNEYWARDWWAPRHQEKLQRVNQGNVDLLMIGDSITQGWEDEGKAVWETFYATRNAVNLGYSGDRTENVLWRLQHGEVDGISPRVAVLMIGTNNTGHRMEKPQYTARGIKAILDELRTRLPETKILLLGVFPRDELPNSPMRQINNEINRIVDDYADDQHIFFLDIGRAFLDDDGKLSREVMPDLLHLNEASYATWANTMEPALQDLLGD
jgi:beta-glucosidase